MTNILWIIAAIIIAVWVVGLLTNIGGLIHLLLVVVVAIVIYNLITGRRSAR